MNLVSSLLGAAATTPDRPALRDGSSIVTHGDVAARAGRGAALLAERVGAGDRVAIMAGNDPAFVTAYLATLAVGAIAVPLNPAAPAHEIGRELSIVAPALLVTSSEHADRARRGASRGDTQVPTFVLDAEAREGTAGLPPVSRATDDVAVLLFTAGTAGPSKAAMLTHGSLLANIEQVQRHPGLQLGCDDVALGVLPFFHIFGLNIVLDLALAAGASIALVEHFHPTETLARVRRDGVTVIAAVPAVYAAWCALAPDDAAADALTDVRLCVSGAAALPAEVATQMKARFGVAIHEGYGLTEASPVVSTSAMAAEPRPGSIGPPLPGVDVRLVDSDGRAVLSGDPGEIHVRGANVFAGYWEDPEATAACCLPTAGCGPVTSRSPTTTVG